MAILTGNLRFDLAAINTYLQLMTSLGISGLSILQPETNTVLRDLGEMLSRDTDEVLQKGNFLIVKLIPIVNHFLEAAPPKKQWYEIAADFSVLCKDTKDLYSFGIEHEWLYERMDCSKLEFAELPLHARIGLGQHAGQANVEEQFLLGDAFFLLEAAELSQDDLQLFADSNRGLKLDNNLYHTMAALNQTVATYSRLSVVSFLAFLEAFANGVGHDFRVRNITNLNSRESEILSGYKKGRFLMLDYKLEAYPRIISGGSSKLVVRDPAQRIEPFKSLIDKFKGQRDSSMHYSPGKEAIWKRPHEWLVTVQECSTTCVDVAREFWRACYPNSAYPSYLEELDYESLKKGALQRNEFVERARDLRKKNAA